MFFHVLLSKKIFKNKNFSTSRALAIVITYVLFILIIVILINFIIPQLIDSIMGFINNIDSYFINLQYFVNRTTDMFGIQRVDLSMLGSFILNYINKLGTDISKLLTQVIGITTIVLSFVTTFLISTIFSIYLLAGKEILLCQFKKVFITYLPRSIYEKCSYVYHITVDVFSKYVIGQLTEALILGILCFSGMIIFDFEYPLLVSVLVGITALVPVVGAYIGGAIALVLLLLITPDKAFLFLIYLMILQQVEGNIIYPRVVGSSLGLPGIWVLLSVTVGGGLGGPIGILLGVPIATVLYTLLKNDVSSKNKKVKQKLK
jgi:predicted PurR-regulated permease PerM